MRSLHKLPGSRREPPGLEWRLLRQLPMLALAGILIPLLCYVHAYLFPQPGFGETVEKHLASVGIAAIAVTLTVWTAVFTVAIGCAIVWIMKGPAYTADSYPLSDADQPRRNAAADGRGQSDQA